VNGSAYRLEFAAGVRKQLERLPGHIYPRIKRIIVSLAYQPRPKIAERLRGRSERYKIAVDRYRIVYRVQDDVLLILGLKVGKKHGPEFYTDVDDLE
jgi:mRNA interferase RelE/StbE